MLRLTLLTAITLGCTSASAGLVVAETLVVVGAGVAEEPRTGVQFEYAVAAAAGPDSNAAAIGMLQIDFEPGGTAIEKVELAVEQVRWHGETGLPLRAELSGTANVKLHRGRRYPRVPAIATVSDDTVSIELDLGRQGVVAVSGMAFSGGNTIGKFEPEQLVVALGEGTTVESAFQAAAAIGDEGRAIGRLSLLANREDGDLVRVDGVAAAATVRPYVGRKRLQLHLAGVAAVDVVPPDGNSPDTCFGDFMFEANAGPHGPFRIDIPDCGDPAAGIEGSDIGSGAVSVTAASTSPLPQ
ncbi:hypothetical protein Mal4_39550 [Maioricimonas rarisocia]|uniref:Uncharacterized protein n=1 Tax=Maioricimonas rarisocia TaxID=2528026 RepID=A0A517ZB03_9PLAN|nr:hypothetical protein [Maioricimonas rarisocia]QDU39609.1 hypothetical protein Mal4_39550 [Maioricimonas rarisocia]